MKEEREGEGEEICAGGHRIHTNRNKTIQKTNMSREIVHEIVDMRNGKMADRTRTRTSQLSRYSGDEISWAGHLMQEAEPTAKHGGRLEKSN